MLTSAGWSMELSTVSRFSLPSPTGPRGNLVRSNNAEVQMVVSFMSMDSMRESRWCSSTSLSGATFRLGSCATCSEADHWVSQATAGDCSAIVVMGAVAFQPGSWRSPSGWAAGKAVCEQAVEGCSTLEAEVLVQRCQYTAPRCGMKAGAPPGPLQVEAWRLSHLTGHVTCPDRLRPRKAAKGAAAE